MIQATARFRETRIKIVAILWPIGLVISVDMPLAHLVGAIGKTAGAAFSRGLGSYFIRLFILQ